MRNKIYEKQKLYHPIRTVKNVHHPEYTKQTKIMNHEITFINPLLMNYRVNKLHTIHHKLHYKDHNRPQLTTQSITAPS
jgi:hypothetical protein